MHPAAYDYFKRWFTPQPGQSVLEVGALDVNSTEQGLVLRDLAKQCKYVGIDFKKGRNVDIVVKKTKPWPLDAASFDWVLSAECLEHDPRPRQTLREIHRVLKVECRLILTAAAGQRKHHCPPHYWNFWPEGLYMLLTENDFRTHHLEMLDRDIRTVAIKNHEWI